MKSTYKIIFTAIIVILFLLPCKINAQVTGINYQAVAVDEGGKEIAGMDIQGNIIPNKAINVRFTILSGSASGTVLYQETHLTNTDSHGLFTLVIGQGNTTNIGIVNNINNIDWSAINQWLKVEIDFKGLNSFKLMGAQQLLTVPFAYYALKSGDSTQTLNLNGNQLSISGGNSINLPVTTYNAGSGININGNVITNTAPNQMQILSISNDTVFLSNGGFAKIPAQNLSINSNQLSISNGNTVNLPITSYNAGTGINITGNIISNSAPNQSVNINAGSGINVNGSYPNYTIVNSSPNQSQVLSISQDTIFLSNGGLVKIPAGFSGNYNDLINKPILFDGNYNSLINKPSLFDGSWISLTNKPLLWDSTWTSIKNKPSLFDGNYNNLSNIPTLFDGNYNSLTNKPILFSGNYSDLIGSPLLWDSTWTSIKNKPAFFDGSWASLIGKPSFAIVATSGSYNDLSNKPILFDGNYSSLSNQPILFDGSWTSLSGKPTLWDSTWASIKNKPTLFDGTWSSLIGKPTLFSGAYDDLTGKPNLWDSTWSSIKNKPTLFDGTWSSITGKPSFATIATSASYNDLSNKPVLFDGDYNSLINKPNLFDGTWTSIVGKPTLFSGSYNDLTGKPTIWDSTWASIKNKPSLFDGNYNSLTNKPNLFDGTWTSLNGKPTLFSGSFDDLSNKPVQWDSTWSSIKNKPSLFDGDYNNLTNKPNLFDGNWTSLVGKPNFATVATSGNYTDLNNLPTIPTQTSQLLNNSGYISNEVQALSISNDTIFLTGGSFVKIPSNPTYVLLPPTTYIQAASDIQNYSATINGILNGNGLSTNVIFEWGLTTTYGNTIIPIQNPITGISNINVNANLSGLQSNTIYHYRIKAINAVNITYSNDISFTTLISFPQLTTSSISMVTGTSANSGGNVFYDGGAMIIASGICWNTVSNPTLANNFTNNGVNNGVFASSLTGLSSGTTYYVRAYATNIIGTAYGNEVIFSTTPNVGQNFKGGIVAYAVQSNESGYDANIPHGLIVAPTSQGSATWWNAISICTDLLLNGYDDWHLPSLSELTKIYNNKDLIGGYSDSYYWSANEQDNDSNNAWVMYFYNASTLNFNKGNSYIVRAVRTF